MHFQDGWLSVLWIRMINWPTNKSRKQTPGCNLLRHKCNQLFQTIIVCTRACLVTSNSLLPHGLQPARLLCPWDFSRQEFWSGLSCSPPGDLPDTGIEPRSPALQADALPSEPPMRPYEALSPHGGESSPSGSVGLSSLQSSVWGAGFPLFRRPAPEVLREAMKRLEQAKAS